MPVFRLQSWKSHPATGPLDAELERRTRGSYAHEDRCTRSQETPPAPGDLPPEAAVPAAPGEQHSER